MNDTKENFLRWLIFLPFICCFGVGAVILWTLFNCFSYSKNIENENYRKQLNTDPLSIPELQRINTAEYIEKNLTYEEKLIYYSSHRTIYTGRNYKGQAQFYSIDLKERERYMKQTKPNTINTTITLQKMLNLWNVDNLVLTYSIYEALSEGLDSLSIKEPSPYREAYFTWEESYNELNDICCDLCDAIDKFDDRHPDFNNYNKQFLNEQDIEDFKARIHDYQSRNGGLYRIKIYLNN